MAVTAETRFWRCVEKTDGCWLWTGCTVRRPGGERYGQIRVDGRKVMRAHRFSYELHYGPIPSGLMVLHTCDVPRCVNPAHLYVGTGKQNAADRDSRGRHRVLAGAAASWTKVTDLDEVLRLRAQGLSQRVIGERLGVKQSTVSRILAGERKA